MEEALVLAPVGRALSRARPDIRNSDQGSPFTDGDYVKLVTGAGVRISMDGRGRALDNVFTERLWRSLKYEGVYPMSMTPRGRPERVWVRGKHCFPASAIATPYVSAPSHRGASHSPIRGFQPVRRPRC